MFNKNLRKENKKLRNQISDLVVDNFKLIKKLNLIQDIVNSETIEKVEEIKEAIW